MVVDTKSKGVSVATENNQLQVEWQKAEERFNLHCDNVDGTALAYTLRELNEKLNILHTQITTCIEFPPIIINPQTPKADDSF